MKASVVIPTKNPGELFKAVLGAVLGQKTEWPYEVIVIDSGSSDGTVEYCKNHDGVRVIEISPSDFGHGKTRNQAISNAKGEYVALLTHDAMPASSSWLASLVEVADADSSIAGVFGKHLAYPGASPFTDRELQMHFIGFSHAPRVRLEDEERYRRDEGYRQFLHFFSDNNSLLRRSVWEEIPYPDVDFAEDQAWAKLIIEAGYSKAYAENAAVFHSHDYGLIERMQRSFDESMAFNRLFGYRLCTSLSVLMRSWMALVHRDIMYAVDAQLWRTHFGVVLKSPVDNFMRVFGHYLGAHVDNIPPRVRLLISRDKRMMSGLFKANNPSVSRDGF